MHQKQKEEYKGYLRISPAIVAGRTYLENQTYFHLKKRNHKMIAYGELRDKRWRATSVGALLLNRSGEF